MTPTASVLLQEMKLFKVIVSVHNDLTHKIKAT